MINVTITVREQVTIVPHAHYSDLAQFSWYVGSHGYVVRSLSNRQSELMHRRIMKALPKQYVDHIDGNRLNNSLSNLRICTNSQNNMNRGLQANSTSGYKGVTWFKAAKMWRAHIKVDGKQIHLGYFKVKEEAALAYNLAALRHHKKFARLNILEGA